MPCCLAIPPMYSPSRGCRKEQRTMLRYSMSNTGPMPGTSCDRSAKRQDELPVKNVAVSRQNISSSLEPAAVPFRNSGDQSVPAQSRTARGGYPHRAGWYSPRPHRQPTRSRTAKNGRCLHPNSRTKCDLSTWRIDAVKRNRILQCCYRLGAERSNA